MMLRINAISDVRASSTQNGNTSADGALIIILRIKQHRSTVRAKPPNQKTHQIHLAQVSGNALP